MLKKYLDHLKKIKKSLEKIINDVTSSDESEIKDLWPETRTR